MREASFPRFSWVGAVGAVAATYVYFLLFAQFALVALARADAGGTNLRLLMGAMAAGGIAGSLAAWRVYRPERARRDLAILFAACSALAALAPAAGGSSWLGIFGGVGLCLGGLAVTLAATLRAATGDCRLGLALGLGTGVAYACCNLPPVFAAAPAAQARLAAAAALLGLGVAPFLAARPPAAPPAEGPGQVGRWVLALLALVWLDSAVFLIIQQVPELRAGLWSGRATLVANAGVHLVAALGSGLLLDAGWRRAPLVGGFALLAGASLLLVAPAAAPLPPQWLYVAGVSLYSVALVHVPAASGRPGVAAAVYAVAGWLGSALGIGMAQDLARVPAAFVVVAGLVLAVALRPFSRRLAAGLALGVVALLAPDAVRAEEDLIGRGRAVYIREGCIHCHSQYVRPQVAADVERWGPATDLAQLLAQRPPLPGNRRQGPDLAHVGNRRSPEWNRLHLQQPRLVSPGSRMPSYAHLFAGTGADGEALVAYLASLGAETLPARLEQIDAWRPAPEVQVDPARARALFQRLCANCHGPDGRGDGPLAARLSVRPPDWPRDGPRRPGAGPEGALLRARLVKFGLPGSPMAGHEYLSDADIVGLAEHIRSCQKIPTPSSP